MLPDNYVEGRFTIYFASACAMLSSSSVHVSFGLGIVVNDEGSFCELILLGSSPDLHPIADTNHKLQPVFEVPHRHVRP